MEFSALIINQRYNGPPDSANGGYVCGLLAGYIEGTAQVTLRRPPPLERPLSVRQRESEGVALYQGTDLIAEAQASSFELQVPRPPSYSEAERASTSYKGFKDHVFPTCFVCGPQRASGDGLGIFPGEASGASLVAAPWIPDATLADASGHVRDEFIWAALDCPGAFAAGFSKAHPMVLGQLTAELLRPVSAGGHYMVIGWPVDRKGRKHLAGTAVFSEAGQLCARAKAIWIEIVL